MLTYVFLIQQMGKPIERLSKQIIIFEISLETQTF